ncbi:MAG TPA: DUF1349 domain-containing protein [Microbacterium sp.]|nr:DUF1349 domain-containing protein [Microbacterium sp.]
MSTPRVGGLPELEWTHAPSLARFDEADGALELTCAAGVDWTNDATGAPPQHKASSLSFVAPDSPFTLEARVEVAGERTTFDAGVLTIWHDSDHWAKLCFEYSPQGEAMVVSVVTRGLSDDVNSAVVTDDAVWLRIGYLGGNVWAFHASRDGIRWDFVRLFSLAGGAAPVRVGFMAQAPLGESCTARFDEIVLRSALLSDLRDGS